MARTVQPGKTFGFNLTGDELHGYETLKDIYEGERESNDARVAAALEGLPAEERALLQSRLTPAPASKDLSQRALFSRALRDALAYQDLLTDKAEADDDDQPNDEGGVAAFGDGE